MQRGGWKGKKESEISLNYWVEREDASNESGFYHINATFIVSLFTFL